MYAEWRIQNTGSSGTLQTGIALIVARITILDNFLIFNYKVGENMSQNTIGPARELTAKWYYKELWGWDLESICEGPVRETFLKALMVCAAGDGELSEDERSWILGRAAAAGAPDELLESLRTYPADEDINEIVGRTLATNNSKRAVVYFAIKAAAADQEYGEQERAKVREIAASMDIPSTEVAQLEILVAEEAVQKLKRISLCFPDGSPFAKIV
ncbi:MAG: hypothetical protein ACU843_15635 [Gammaproteobacteria bacterium]